MSCQGTWVSPAVHLDDAGSGVRQTERVTGHVETIRPTDHIRRDARGRPTLGWAALAAVALLVAACGSSSGSGGSTSASTMPPGSTLQKGPGFSIGLGPNWQVSANPGTGISLMATNTVAGHNWLLLLSSEADKKPSGQSFDDYAAVQRAKCQPGTVPDTLVIPAGPVYVCRAELTDLVVLDYRLPVGRDVWHLALGFEDGKYSGAGQDEAETILRTLVLTQ